MSRFAVTVQRHAVNPILVRDGYYNVAGAIWLTAGEARDLVVQLIEAAEAVEGKDVPDEAQ